MLAKTPLAELALSAKDLCIKDWERAGLLEFVQWVDAGVLGAQFDHRDCESCIGWYVHRFHKPHATWRQSAAYVNKSNGPLDKLYYPHRYAKDAREAAQMVRGFLMFGKVPEGSVSRLSI